MPSLLGLTLCIICLTGTTWSWFTDNVTASMQSIKSANYSITVDIEDGDKLEDGKYNLSQKTEGKGYQVTVKANGSASTGYFSLSGPDGFLPLYSTQLAPGEAITFTFYPRTAGKYYFDSAWGTYSGGNTFKNSDIIGTPIEPEKSNDDPEEGKGTEVSSETVDSTPALRPHEEANADKDNQTEVPDETGDTFPPHISNEDNNLKNSVEQPKIETIEDTFGNTEQ